MVKMIDFDPNNKRWQFRYFSTISPGVKGCKLFEVLDKYNYHVGYVVTDFHGKPISGLFHCKWDAIAWANP